MSGQTAQCEWFKDRLDDYVDGALSHDDALKLISHADACAQCGAQLEGAEKLRDMLLVLDKDTALPPEGQAAWRAKVRQLAGDKRRGAKAHMRAFMSVAAALTVLFTGTAYLRHQAFISPAVGTGENVAAYQVIDQNIAPKGQALWLSDSVASDGETMENAEVKGGEAGRMVVKEAERAIETREFDQSALNLQELVDENGAYLENTDVSGLVGSRVGTYVVRVPERQLADFLTALEAIGETVYEREGSRDISEYYYEAEARLSAYAEQLGRLNELLPDAGTVLEVADIEERISQVQLEIDRLEGQIGGGQEGSGSVVSITLTEAAAVREGTLGARMQTGFFASLTWLSGFLSDAAVALSYAAPVLAVAIVLLVIILIIMRRRRR